MSSSARTSYVFRRDGPHCCYCKQRLRRREATVDHYVPLALGGADAPYNWRLACAPCNNAKDDMPPEEWERVLLTRPMKHEVKPSRAEILARLAPRYRDERNSE